jgi:hypothetical protein
MFHPYILVFWNSHILLTWNARVILMAFKLLHQAFYDQLHDGLIILCFTVFVPLLLTLTSYEGVWIFSCLYV